MNDDDAVTWFRSLSIRQRIVILYLLISFGYRNQRLQEGAELGIVPSI
jgi:hypothetical protein